MRLETVICEQLLALGAKVVFGVMGEGNMQWIARLESVGISYVPARHEAAAVSMADAYAQATGDFAVCTVTQGPGLTNAATALAEASRNRSPLLVLTGSIDGSLAAHNQALDIAALVTALGCTFLEGINRAEYSVDLRHAVESASEGRRPVVVGLSFDDPRQPISRTRGADARSGRELRLGTTADAAELLANSKYPVVIAGRGAALAGAGPALEALAVRVGALVATTAPANGLFSHDPFSLGIVGDLSSDLASRMLARADVIFIVGASLNPSTTRHGDAFGDDTRLIHIDSELSAIGAITQVDLGVVGDARGVAVDVLADLGERHSELRGFRTHEVAEAIATQSAVRLSHQAPNVVDPRQLIERLDDLLPAARTIVTDGGYFVRFAWVHLAPPDAAGFVFTQSFMAVGLGIATAIGAALARPDRLTVLVIGDGGLAMSLGELETAVRLKIPMLIVVMNDQAYGAEVHALEDLGLPSDEARFAEVDFAGIAQQLGANGQTVRSLSQLGSIRTWLDSPSEPFLLDCRIDGRVR